MLKFKEYFDWKKVRCSCGKTLAHRHSRRTKKLMTICGGKAAEMKLFYSIYHCHSCKKFFPSPMGWLVRPYSKYTRYLQDTTLRLKKREDISLSKTSQRMKEIYGLDIPMSTIHEWTLLED